MVIDMDKTRLRKIEQLQQILSATPAVTFKARPVGSAADHQRYEHISRVLMRFDCKRSANPSIHPNLKLRTLRPLQRQVR